MAQYVYTMNRVGKVVPPKKTILQDISLSFFPGAKIGVLGLNGSGKSTLLRIMAGIDDDILGEARPQPGGWAGRPTHTRRTTRAALPQDLSHSTPDRSKVDGHGHAAGARAEGSCCLQGPSCSWGSGIRAT